MNIPISKFKRIRAYVDTSVFGGLNDDEFAEASVRFFENVRNGRFTLLISQMLLDELQPSPELVKRDFESLPQNYLERVEVTDEVVDLAQSYLATGVLPEYAKGDALACGYGNNCQSRCHNKLEFQAYCELSAHSEI